MPQAKPRKQLSLRARALAYLAKREYSSVELEKKLSRFGEPEEIKALLNEFLERKWLNEARFAEQYVASKSRRYGIARIEHDLASHKLADSVLDDALEAARGTELERALVIWKQRFGDRVSDEACSTTLDAGLEDELRGEQGREFQRLAREEALKAQQKQHRFLAGRGFSPEVIRQVLLQSSKSARLR